MFFGRIEGNPIDSTPSMHTCAADMHSTLDVFICIISVEPLENAEVISKE